MITRFRISSLAMNTGQIAGLPKNPRSWTQSDIDRLAKSIEETPELLDARPLIVVEHGNKFVVLGGNLRLSAIKKLGWQDAPVYLLPQDTPIEKLKEIVLKDNGSFGKWDYDALANEWDDLPLPEWGVPAWDAQEVGGGQPDVQEDDFNPDDGVLVRCNPGDIWQLGDHRLMCGDSIDLEQVKKLTGGAKIDMVFTDPPYGNGDSGKYGRGQLGIRTILGDEDLGVFNSFVSIMKCNRIVYFLQWRTLAESMQTIKNKGMRVNTIAVWDKKNAGLNGGGGIAEQWEAIVFAGEIKYRKFGGNVFSVSREQHKRSESPHPHQKPLTLLAEIFDFIDGADYILDPFGGSGSTMMACEQLGKTCYMMELDPHYCDVIIARWEKLTGKTAIKT